MFLAIALFVSLYGHSRAYSLQVSDFLKDYIANNEVILSQKAQSQLAESQLKIASDLWETKFQLQPSSIQSDQKYTLQSNGSSTTFSNTRSTLTGKISQKLPKGFDITLEGYKVLSDNNSSFEGTEKELQATLTMDLWQNAFGIQEDRWIRSAEKASLAEKIKLKNVIIEQCHKGIDLFATLATYQELDLLAEQKFESSKVSLDIAKKSFSQRLIRNIDLLSAEADFLNSQTEVRNQKTKTKYYIDQLMIEGGFEFQKNFLNFSEEKKSSQLSFPNDLINTPKTFSSDSWKNSPLSQASHLIHESAQLSQQAARYSYRSKILAGVS
ncbi:MAG: hypothetical protein KDD34_06735, partial [Bdellovibrionales bacterium]|nr:hypothetical protein [Bdellovibrionales bacterium]